MDGNPGLSQSSVDRLRASGGRIDWVDYAKGFCIIFVVMMHATLGVEKAAGETGWMHLVVQFAKPFRMPDFFMISGLFLGLVIARPWRRYLDRKVVHFAYFYILWVTIQFALKAPQWLGEGISYGEIMSLWGWSFLQPFGTLWFIYLLPVFFVVTRLLRPVPWQIVLAAAALLEILPVHTGSVIVDEFASRYVYFFAGYLFATNIFAIAEWAKRNASKALLGLAAWVLVNGIATFTPVPESMSAMLRDRAHLAFISDLPIVSLSLGAAGAVAVILLTALLSQLRWSAFLGYLGRHSIVIYLAFFFPMAVSRILLLKFAPFLDIGTVSLLVTAAGVTGPVILHLIIQKTGYGKFLFERPQWARLERDKPVPAQARLHPAE